MEESGCRQAEVEGLGDGGENRENPLRGVARGPLGDGQVHFHLAVSEKEPIEEVRLGWKAGRVASRASPPTSGSFSEYLRIAFSVPSVLDQDILDHRESKKDPDDFDALALSLQGAQPQEALASDLLPWFGYVPELHHPSVS